MTTPTDNLWVGDLPPAIQTEELEAVFQAYGQVTQCRVMAPKGGRAASGLVRFSTSEEAGAVMETITTAGNAIEGLEHPVLVRFANQRSHPTASAGAWGPTPPAVGAPAMHKPSNAWAPGGKGQGGDKMNPAPSDNVFIGDLPADWTTENVQAVFGAYGGIVSVKHLPSRGPGGSSALVRFSGEEEAAWIVDNLNGNIPEGLDTPIQARFANNAGARQPSGGVPTGGNPKQPIRPSSAVPSTGPIPAAGGRDGSYDKGYSKGYGKGGGNHGSVRSILTAAKSQSLLGPAKAPVECQVYIRGLPSDTGDVDLLHLFSPFGPIASGGAKAMLHPDGACRGIGFVDFLCADSAQAAISALNGLSTADGCALGVSIKAASKERGQGQGQWAPAPKPY